MLNLIKIGNYCKYLPNTTFDLQKMYFVLAWFKCFLLLNPLNVKSKYLGCEFKSICSRDPMKNSTQGDFLQEYLQPVFCSSSWNFSSPHYVACFVCQSLQIFVEKVTLWVMFHKISWKNINFCGLKRETFISNGRKI